MKKLILILLIFLNFNFTFTKDIKIDPNPENIINDDYFHCPYEEEITDTRVLLGDLKLTAKI